MVRITNALKSNVYDQNEVAVYQNIVWDEWGK